MQKKYKRILSFIGLLLGVCIFVGIAYLFYDKVLSNPTDVEVIGELSVNYINGFKIDGNNTYNFSVTNNGENDVYYEIIINNLKNYDSKVKYSLHSKEASLAIDKESLDTSTNMLANNILIKMGNTQNFTLTLSDNANTSFKIEIKKTTDLKEYFYATIIKNNDIKDSPITKVSVENATSDEGLIEDLDDDGETYYFRGNVTNNYVLIGEDLWRIVRINGDGTVKLVLDGIAGELSNYNNDVETAEDYQNINIMSVLNNYYETYLTNYEDYIASYKYCFENGRTGEDDNKIYNAYNRLFTNKIPTLNCLGANNSSRIGLLTVDEVIYAGATFDQDNTSYYLYNSNIDNIWWTSSLAKGNLNQFYPFSVEKNGKVVTNTEGTLYRGLRPSINLNRKVTATGDGTINNPYILNLE